MSILHATFGAALSVLAASTWAQNSFQLGAPPPPAPAKQVSAPSWLPPAVPATLTPDHYLDNKNGVTWRRCELGKAMSSSGNACTGAALKMTWIDAIEVVNELNTSQFEGRNDWRLPSGLELRSLLLDDAQIRAGKYPVGLGSASSFGGYAIDTDNTKCVAANRLIHNVFGSVNSQSDDFFASQRWMADNTDKKAWQTPLSINLVSNWGMHRQGHCNVLIYAFMEDQFDAKRPGTMRPHAALPVLVVHGGTGDANWVDATRALGSKAEILKQSQLESRQQLAALVGTYNKVKDYVRDVMSHANSSSSNSGGAGQKKFSCSYQCRGSLFATGGRHSATSWGMDESAARAALKPDAEKLCRAENSGKGGAWWADMALCKEQ
jgi:Protein of unknown function (DUF1566)